MEDVALSMPTRDVMRPIVSLVQWRETPIGPINVAHVDRNRKNT